MDKPFPKPPSWNNRAPPSPEPQTPSTDALSGSLGLSDDEFQYICKKYLKPSQLNDIATLTWVCSYMNNRNASQAARDAGWSINIGVGFRRKPEIHALIEALTTKLVRKFGYDEHEIVERVKEISEFDPIEFENPDGTFKTSLQQISPGARRAIKKFKCKNIIEDDPNGMPRVRGQLIEVELWDKMEAHRLLAREKGTFKETKRVEHDVTTNMKDTLLGAAERAERRAIEGAREVTHVEVESKED